MSDYECACLVGGEYRCVCVCVHVFVSKIGMILHHTCRSYRLCSLTLRSLYDL